MIDGRTAALGLCLAALTACGQQPPPARVGAAASAPGNAAASAPARASAAVPDPEGGPRITLSPDNVHIEYHVYGHGDPAVVLVHGWAS